MAQVKDKSKRLPPKGNHRMPDGKMMKDEVLGYKGRYPSMFKKRKPREASNDD